MKHLKHHISRVHSAAKFPCGICGKSFSRRDSLIRHIKGHKGAQQVTIDSGAIPVDQLMMDGSQYVFHDAPLKADVDMPCDNSDKSIGSPYAEKNI